MTDGRLAAIREALETELHNAEAGVARLKAELEAASQTHKAVQGALSALGRSKTPKPPAKPAPKKQHVVTIVASLLEGAGPLPAEQLEEAVKKRLRQAGLSHAGLGLRFGEALRDDRFVKKAEGVYALRDASATADGGDDATTVVSPSASG